MGLRSTAAAAGTIRISVKPPKIEQLLTHFLNVSIHLMGGDAETGTGLQILKQEKQKRRSSMGDREAQHFSKSSPDQI